MTLSTGDTIQIPTVVNLVAEEIRRLVVSGELREGERLVEERFVERFGVSRPPLREALRLLERDGLVESIPRKGFIVAHLREKDIEEIYDLREVLERFTIEAVFPLTDLSLLEPMEEKLEEIRLASEANNVIETLRAKDLFHSELVKLSGNSRVIRTYESLRHQLAICMAANLTVRNELSGDTDALYRRHRDLLEVLRGKDVPSMLDALKNHGSRVFLDAGTGINPLSAKS